MDRIAQLNDFIKETPNDPFLHYALTMEYVKLDDRDRSRAGFENLVSVYPDYVGTYYHYAKFLEKQNEKEAAELIYEKGILVANKMRNRHAMGELQAALNLLRGLEDEDDY
ncbi:MULTISPECIES: tetratricopeptide repeat protein [Sphingobacterium]|uniref:tetratricopeptide repeat protein n=1 Tax=Sphingobacterium TaxID=28453 RepID=UPI0013DD83C2|nr:MULTISPECIES: tetratricopeptide repeat protein [unclassified Sphingobacterium]